MGQTDPTGITGSDIVCRLRQIQAGALAVTSPDMTAASGFANTVVVVARTVNAVVDDKGKIFWRATLYNVLQHLLRAFYPAE